MRPKIVALGYAEHMVHGLSGYDSIGGEAAEPNLRDQTSRMHDEFQSSKGDGGLHRYNLGSYERGRSRWRRKSTQCGPLQYITSSKLASVWQLANSPQEVRSTAAK